MAKTVFKKVACLKSWKKKYQIVSILNEYVPEKAGFFRILEFFWSYNEVKYTLLSKNYGYNPYLFSKKKLQKWKIL